MPARQTSLPKLWLVSDRRNDTALNSAILRLPRGSGVVFRHLHLPAAERALRLLVVRRLCRRGRHVLVVAGDGRASKPAGVAGTYGPPAPLRLLANVHSLREIARANALGAGAIVLSPLYPTRSHPGARGLGPVRALLLARRARVPVIALGGMTAARFRGLQSARIFAGWAAIDGLS